LSCFRRASDETLRTTMLLRIRASFFSGRGMW
jgi:hypothetical protein